MSETLTIERVMEIGQESKRLLLMNLSPGELDTYINPAYRKKLHDEGVEQGIEQGKLALHHSLQAILQHRLGEIPSAVDEQLRTCNLTQLNTLVNPALDAATWDEFTAHLPAPPDTNEAQECNRD